MRAREFLLEYNRQVTLQNYLAGMWDRFYREGANRHARLGFDLEDANEPVISQDTKMYYVDQLLQKLEAADPTRNKEYVQWMARTYTKGGVFFEDVITQVAQDLVIFDRLKRRRLIPPPYNDINRYADFHLFAETVAQYEEQLPDEEVPINKGQAKEIYRDSQLRIIQPVDKDAACYYGRGTKWCTAATTAYNAFDAYNRKGPLYIIIPSQPKYTGEKYQLHFVDMQFMNEKDQPIDLHGLVTRFPQLVKLFGKEAKEKGILQFFYSDDDIQGIVRIIFPKIRSKLKSYIVSNTGVIAKEIVDGVLAQYKMLRSFKDDFLDNAADDVKNSFDIYYNVMLNAALSTPAILYSEDAFHDVMLSSDELRDFSLNSNVYELALSLFDEEDAMQDELHFEIDQTLNGELSMYYNKALRVIWYQETEQYLNS